MLAAPKTPQTLDFIDYRGVCPQFYRGTGNGERGTGMPAKKFSSTPTFRPPRPSPPLRAARKTRHRPSSGEKPSEIKLDAKLGWRNDEIRLGVVFEVAGHKTRIEYVLSCERDLKEDSIILIGH